MANNNNQQDIREQQLRDKIARESEKQQRKNEEAAKRLADKFNKGK